MPEHRPSTRSGAVFAGRSGLGPDRCRGGASAAAPPRRGDPGPDAGTEPQRGLGRGGPVPDPHEEYARDHRPDRRPPTAAERAGAWRPSSTQPEHLIAAANDYRTIDFAEDNRRSGRANDSAPRAGPGSSRDVLHSRCWGCVPGRPRRRPASADAWMGVYRSCDRGRTWYREPAPGLVGRTRRPPPSRHPCSGLQTASDPVLAPAPEGRAYLGGLAFTRGRNERDLRGALHRPERPGRGACFAYELHPGRGGRFGLGDRPLRRQAHRRRRRDSGEGWQLLAVRLHGLHDLHRTGDRRQLPRPRALRAAPRTTASPGASRSR